MPLLTCRCWDLKDEFKAMVAGNFLLRGARVRRWRESSVMTLVGFSSFADAGWRTAILGLCEN